MADAYTPLDADPYPVTLGSPFEDIVESGTLTFSVTPTGDEAIGRGQGVIQIIFSGTASLEAVGDVTESGLVVLSLAFDGDAALGTDGTATFVITHPDSATPAELVGRFRVTGFLDPVGDRDEVETFTFVPASPRVETGDFLP
jgi:hypothetical protein